MRFLITGASGFIGGHVALACLQRAQTVTVFARPESDVAELERQGAAVARGSLNDSAQLRTLIQEIDVVVHCAAKVGDWGPVADYRQVNVEGLRTLLDACKGQALQRFVHLSSLGVYPARHHYGSDESMPLPARHRDGYSQSKVEAEQLALQYYQDYGVPVTVLRPGFVYGPRDQTVMPRIIQNLRDGAVRFPGGGRRALNTIFIRNLLDAIFLAVEREEAVGQVFNLTDGELVTKRQFLDAVADRMDLPRASLAPPYWLAWLVTWCAEKIARLRGAKQAPNFNFTRFKFMAMNLDFSIAKARRVLGYQPRVAHADGMAETMNWYRARADA